MEGEARVGPRVGLGMTVEDLLRQAEVQDVRFGRNLSSTNVHIDIVRRGAHEGAQTESDCSVARPLSGAVSSCVGPPASLRSS